METPVVLPENPLELLEYEAQHGKVNDEIWQRMILDPNPSENPRITVLKEYYWNIGLKAIKDNKSLFAEGDWATGFLWHGMTRKSADAMRIAYLRSKLPSLAGELAKINGQLTLLRKEYQPLAVFGFTALVFSKDQWSTLNSETFDKFFSQDQLIEGRLIGIYEDENFSKMPENYFSVGQIYHIKLVTSNPLFNFKRNLDRYSVLHVLSEEEIKEVYQLPFSYTFEW